MSRSGRSRSRSAVDHEWIDEAGELEDLVAGELVGAATVGIDTEFHRERTYYAHLALVQVSWSGGVALIDPLRVDLTPLAAVLESDTVIVMHAAQQDLEILERACGAAPHRLHDTQIAAGFLGYASPSLSTLCEQELGIRLPKGDRLTDWLGRPLGDPQRRYAAADVAHLINLHGRQTTRLMEMGRLEWVEAECRKLLDRPRTPQDPETAWLRIKEARHLRGSARGVAKELAAWRERTAAATDQPVRFVLSDLALVGVAQSAPDNESDLRKIRGIDGRHLRDGSVGHILAAVRRGLDVPAEALSASPTGSRATLDSELRPAIALVSAWVAQVAREQQFDPVLLATRSDIEGFLRRDGSSRLDEGWRRDLLGSPIEDLIEGRAALAFVPRHGLVLEARSAGADDARR